MATDTITGALSAKDTLGVEHTIFPQTNISAVQGLQTELNKIIKAISTSGGTITLTKNDGTTLTATIGTATTSADGLLSKADKSKLDGIATGANNYSLPTASASTLGGVKVGTNLSISNGVLSATDTKYTLPTATSSVLGGVKTGSNITNSSGTISLTKANVTAALGFTPSSVSGGVSGVKGSAESTYRTGQVNITKDNIGLGNVDNTADDEKTVAKADQLTWGSIIKVNLGSEEDVTFDGSEGVEIGVGDILPITHGGTDNSKGIARGIGTFVTTYSDGSRYWALLSSINLNELKSSGSHGGSYMCLYECINCVNLPSGYGYGFLLVFFSSSDYWQIQIFIAQGISAAKDGTIFIRSRSNTNWKKIEGIQI